MAVIGTGNEGRKSFFITHNTHLELLHTGRATPRSHAYGYAPYTSHLAAHTGTKAERNAVLAFLLLWVHSETRWSKGGRHAVSEISIEALAALCDVTRGTVNRWHQMWKEWGIVEIGKRHNGLTAVTHLSPFGTPSTEAPDIPEELSESQKPPRQNHRENDATPCVRVPRFRTERESPPTPPRSEEIALALEEATGVQIRSRKFSDAVRDIPDGISIATSVNAVIDAHPSLLSGAEDPSAVAAHRIRQLVDWRALDPVFVAERDHQQAERRRRNHARIIVDPVPSGNVGYITGDAIQHLCQIRAANSHALASNKPSHPVDTPSRITTPNPRDSVERGNFDAQLTRIMGSV